MEITDTRTGKRIVNRLQGIIKEQVNHPDHEISIYLAGAYRVDIYEEEIRKLLSGSYLSQKEEPMSKLNCGCEIRPGFPISPEIMTRQETRKEVGEWLDALSHSPRWAILARKLRLGTDRLLKGETPEPPQADCHIEPVPKVLHT